MAPPRQLLAWCLALASTAAACAGPNAVPPAAVGCYDLQVTGWSQAAASVTGFGTPPAYVALDSTPGTQAECRVLVPRTWRLADAPNANRASCSSWSRPFRRLTDSLLFERPSRASPAHRLAGDSLIITISGWGGSLTGYLAPAADGYRGLGQVAPRQLAQAVGPLTLQLLRRTCDSLDLVAVALPN